MKRYSIATLSKLPLANNAHTPAPFPGIWPTRIAWNLSAHQIGTSDSLDIHTEYIGKPSPESLRHYSNQMQPAGAAWQYWVNMWEFDKNHVILNQAFDPINGWKCVSSRLFSAYHPWENPGMSLDHFKTKPYLKNIGGFRVYSGTPKLKLEYIQKYKLWMLQNCGKELKSRDDRIAARLELMRERKRGRL